MNPSLSPVEPSGRPQRSRSDTVFHQPEEVFNVPTPERLVILSELETILNHRKVPAAVWACLQVADLPQLRSLLEQARSAPALLSVTLNAATLIPLKWMQKPAATPKTDKLSSSSSSEASSTRSKATRAKILAQQRDQDACVLTRRKPYEVAHIFPHYMMHARRETLFDKLMPNFCELLLLFWTPDRVQRWREEIFSDPEHPDAGVETCLNMLCLGKDVHDMWSKGLFALRPVTISPDKRELLVEFYWQPKQTHTAFENVQITKLPLSSKDLTSVDAYEIPFRPDPSSPNFALIRSGQVFTFRTPDPERLPLPSFKLLQMQWALNRVVSMSATAEAIDMVDDDDDDCDDDDPLFSFDGKTIEGIEKWVPRPPHGFESSDDTDDHSTTETTASTSPTPIKASTTAITSTSTAEDQLV